MFGVTHVSSFPLTQQFPFWRHYNRSRRTSKAIRRDTQTRESFSPVQTN